MREMAKAYRSSYTRYADDITLSTSLATFPPEIAKLEIVAGRLKCTPGQSLVSVITSNGFAINENKLRLSTRRDRQEVTGLTTNIFPNVHRTYVRQIRAMLHAWKKYGLDSATSEYAEKYFKGHRHPDRPPPDFARVVKGKITYLGMVRGKNDPIYGRFIQELRVLAPGIVKLHEVYDPFADIMDNVVILETYEGDDIHQGTAFLLKDYGFVTCAHVLRGAEGSTTAFTRHDRTPHAIKVVAKDDEIDLALLNIDIETRGGLTRGISRRLKVGDEIQLAGFPNHNYGDSGILDLGAVIGWRRVGQIDRFLISRNIIFGNSGGPVLDRVDRVIGIAVTGAASEEESRTTEAHGVIPVEALEALLAHAQNASSQA